jgi:hypothetical protein
MSAIRRYGSFALCLAAAAAGSAASYISFGAVVSLESFPVILLSFMLIYLFAMHAEASKKKRHADAEAIGIIGFLASCATPLPTALAEIVRSNPGNPDSAELLKLGMRLRLGENLEAAIPSVKLTKGLHGGLSYASHSSKSGMPLSDALAEAELRLGSESALLSEKALGSRQRNLTLLMATGTVVPSLVLFLFTACAIADSSTFVYSAFSAAMCGIIPAAYAAVGASLGD